MKKLILLFVSALLLNCSSDNNIDEIEISDPTPTSYLKKGIFISGTHPTSGTATISTDKKQLIFTNFKTDSGPKLLVYLTTETGSDDFISLGDLKGIQGNYAYDIPNNIDLDKYNIVDIWCVDFSVSFGTAALN